MNDAEAAAALPIDRVFDIVTALKRAAQKWGNRCAWIFDEPAERLTFSEIDARSDRIAAALAASGVAPGDHVAVMLRNQPEFPLAWLGIQKAGAIMVPLNIHYRSADAGYIIEHARVSAVVTADDFVDLLAGVCDGLERSIVLISVDGNGGARAENLAALSAAADEAPQLPVHDHTLINIQYTSGTTGEPKGCMLSNLWLMSFARRVVAAHEGLDNSDVLLTAQPFYYVDPQWNVAVSTLCGATLVVLDRFHPATFWAKVRQYEVTWFYCLGVMPKLLLNSPVTELDRSHALKRVLCSAIPPLDHAEIVARWGVPWYDAFGMTESGVDLVVDSEDHDMALGTGCIGTPVPGREARVVDASDRPTAVGEIGQLVLRGVGLMDGYYRDPEATLNTFRNGWLHTGDLARRDAQGRFYYIGRTKDMIRRSGENIAAAEVEAVIMQHPAVLLAACIAVQDDLRGEEIKAYVVLEPEVTTTVTPADLAKFCADRLAYFKVPRYWAFRDHLPLTPSERVRKEVLKGESEDPRSDAFDQVDGAWH